uniref:chitinase n=1 Tax=Balaenoptera musculus TaxID=9771 RepID=A0A8C0CVL7_BALMU
KVFVLLWRLAPQWLLLSLIGSAYKIVCYFTNWSQYRPEPAKFFPKDVDPCLCTHLIYAFATMNDNKIAPYEWNDIDVLYTQFQTLKDWSMGIESTVSGSQFTTMVSTAAKSKIFICSVIDFLRQYICFINIYAFIYASGIQQPLKFTLSSLQEMLQAFEEEAKERGKPRLLITAAVSAGKGTIDAGYEIAEIGKLLDFISVMTYDFHHGWDTSTRHNSPLRVGSKDQGDICSFNCEYAMKPWRDNGVPSEKLIMGFLTYGRTFWLRSSGPYTGEDGFWTYYEICTFLSEVTNAWIEDQKVPYAYKNPEGVGYDNIKSYGYKVDFLKENNFGGAMIWAIDLDDLLGSFCNKGKYSLTIKLKSLLGLSSGFCANISGDSSSGGEGGGDGGSGGDEGFCTGKADGIFSNPKDTTKFHQCVGGKTFHSQCAQGLVFHQNRKCCNWPSI